MNRIFRFFFAHGLLFCPGRVKAGVALNRKSSYGCGQGSFLGWLMKLDRWKVAQIGVMIVE